MSAKVLDFERIVKETAIEAKRRRISELPGLVFLELQETNTTVTQSSVVISLSVSEFNDADTIRHLDIYLLRELSSRGGDRRHRTSGAVATPSYATRLSNSAASNGSAAFSDQRCARHTKVTGRTASAA